MERKLEKPLPSGPSSASAGTQQSVKARSCVSLACHPSFFGAGAATNPGLEVGTMNEEIWLSSVLAVIVTIEVIGVPELVMNALVPFNSQPPSEAVARLRSARASLPQSASVRPKAPSARPL